MVEILSIIFRDGSIIIDFNIYVLIAIIAGIFIFLNIVKRIRKNSSIALNPVELEVDIGSTKTKFEVIRNCQNLYVANRIYIELITRKAALDIDPDEDVIADIYNSWYELFRIIRDEIKNIPAEYLENMFDQSNQLIELTIKILNDGLRPHMTKYQADFRKWFRIAQENNPNESPQKLQKNYGRYEELITDMQQVNKVLYNYADELKKFIKGSR